MRVKILNVHELFNIFDGSIKGINYDVCKIIHSFYSLPDPKFKIGENVLVNNKIFKINYIMNYNKVYGYIYKLNNQYVYENKMNKIRYDNLNKNFSELLYENDSILY